MRKILHSSLAMIVVALLLVSMIAAPVALADEGSSSPAAVQTLAMSEDRMGL